eukprot:jgi/Mesvir1/4627/Mv25082-RA.1
MKGSLHASRPSSQSFCVTHLWPRGKIRKGARVACARAEVGKTLNNDSDSQKVSLSEEPSKSEDSAEPSTSEDSAVENKQMRKKMGKKRRLGNDEVACGPAPVQVGTGCHTRKAMTLQGLRELRREAEQAVLVAVEQLVGYDEDDDQPWTTMILEYEAAEEKFERKRAGGRKASSGGTSASLFEEWVSVPAAEALPPCDAATEGRHGLNDAATGGPGGDVGQQDDRTLGAAVRNIYRFIKAHPGAVPGGRGNTICKATYETLSALVKPAMKEVGGKPKDSTHPGHFDTVKSQMQAFLHVCRNPGSTDLCDEDELERKCEFLNLRGRPERERITWAGFRAYAGFQFQDSIMAPIVAREVPPQNLQRMLDYAKNAMEAATQYLVVRSLEGNLRLEDLEGRYGGYVADKVLEAGFGVSGCATFWRLAAVAVQVILACAGKCASPRATEFPRVDLRAMSLNLHRKGVTSGMLRGEEERLPAGADEDAAPGGDRGTKRGREGGEEIGARCDEAEEDRADGCVQSSNEGATGRGRMEKRGKGRGPEEGPAARRRDEGEEAAVAGRPAGYFDPGWTVLRMRSTPCFLKVVTINSPEGRDDAVKEVLLDAYRGVGFMAGQPAGFVVWDLSSVQHKQWWDKRTWCTALKSREPLPEPEATVSVEDNPRYCRYWAVMVDTLFSPRRTPTTFLAIGNEQQAAGFREMVQRVAGYISAQGIN